MGRPIHQCRSFVPRSHTLPRVVGWHEASKARTCLLFVGKIHHLRNLDRPPTVICPDNLAASSASNVNVTLANAGCLPTVLVGAPAHLLDSLSSFCVKEGICDEFFKCIDDDARQMVIETVSYANLNVGAKKYLKSKLDLARSTENAVKPVESHQGSGAKRAPIGSPKGSGAKRARTKATSARPASGSSAAAIGASGAPISRSGASYWCRTTCGWRGAATSGKIQAFTPVRGTAEVGTAGLAE